MRSLVMALAAALCLASRRMARDLPVERLFDAPDLQGPVAAPDALFAGRQARELPARARRRAGGLRPLGLRRREEDASPAGGLPRCSRPRRKSSRPRKRRGASASASRRCAASSTTSGRRTRARSSSRSRATSITTTSRSPPPRPCGGSRETEAFETDAAVLAARPLRQLHPRPGPLRGRGRDRHGAAPDDRRRRTRSATASPNSSRRKR